ncbi:MAG: phosphodiesterase [Oscillospiraceae bacterium]|nr:phosphodiesterase [Oscillospiraceae bacterium]
MKLMIASDLHGSAPCTQKLLAAFHREGAERLVLLGDLLYHGPRNDLPEGYDPKAVIALLNAEREQLLCVRGNCDTEVDQMVLSFPILADYVYLSVEKLRIFATHGHHYHAGALPPLREGELLLHGHTHVPTCALAGETWILNPGSVSIPKENSPQSYLILEQGVFTWKDLEGRSYHVFDPGEPKPMEKYQF